MREKEKRFDMIRAGWISRSKRGLLIILLRLRQCGSLVSGWDALGEELEIVRIFDFDMAFESQTVGMSVGIGGDAA